jgi:hypothetical protein
VLFGVETVLFLKAALITLVNNIGGLNGQSPKSTKLAGNVKASHAV